MFATTTVALTLLRDSTHTARGSGHTTQYIDRTPLLDRYLIEPEVSRQSLAPAKLCDDNSRPYSDHDYCAVGVMASSIRHRHEWRTSWLGCLLQDLLILARHLVYDLR
jgi:hypothetical protein